MSISKELNARMLESAEEQRVHVEYRSEYGYYGAVAEGDVEAVKKVLVRPDNVSLYENGEYGILSKDRLRNIRYHFVVAAALITRLCVEKGLERELAYTMSDLYIEKMDRLQTAERVLSLYNEMLLAFTGKMADLPKHEVYSIHAVKAINYICRHRTERITAASVSEALGLNRSYLSTLFKRETGTSISGYIRAEKLKAAANMLVFSDCSCADIAGYFGFASQSHFIRLFREETGLTPAEYRKKNSRSLFFRDAR